MLRYSATCLLLIVSVSASGAAACDLAMVTELEKRGYTRDQVAQICSMRPQKTGEPAKGGSQDEPAEPSPAKVGGSAPSDKLMERPKHDPIKIDDPIEFMRGYWKVTWRVTNVPNFPPRVLALRFSEKAGKLGLAMATWEKVAGSEVPRTAEQPLHFVHKATTGGIWLENLRWQTDPANRGTFTGVGFFRQAGYGLSRSAPSIVIDLSYVTSRGFVKGGFVEQVGSVDAFSGRDGADGWSLIGELEFERIPEDKLVEVLKSLN